MYRREPFVKPDPAAKIGVLIANLGTSDQPTTGGVRRFLREFLSDPRVIELPRWRWLPILHVFVLIRRPIRVAKLYRSIWTPEASPLLVISKKQIVALEQCFSNSLNPEVCFALGMRYGNPSIASAALELKEKGCERLLFMPLYPQYSAASTASSVDALTTELRLWRRVPEVRTINSYHDDPGYVAAVVRSIEELWDRDGEPERLLLSYHGYPVRYLEGGDPYGDQCHETSKLILDRLGLDEQRVVTVFQSQFGREEWIKPATNTTIEALAKSGVRSLDVICPSFSADCLETLEEIDLQNRKIFEDHGGERYRLIPCLNDRDDHIDALAAILRRNLQGWCDHKG